MNEKHKEKDALPIAESATTDSDSPDFKDFEKLDTKLVESNDANFDGKVGQIVGGHYEILKPIAEGGMSAVYLARHQLLDQEVALKFILPSLIHDKNTTKRFQSEAKAASLLQHQNIASVREFGIDDTKRPFIVMEFVSGKTELLKRFEQSANTAELNFKASEFKSDALAGDVFKQLNMTVQLPIFEVKEKGKNQIHQC